MKSLAIIYILAILTGVICFIGLNFMIDNNLKNYNPKKYPIAGN
jgi:hypothetical protein